MSYSDWVLAGTALFLGFVALFVPFISEWIKRRLYAPDLHVAYSHSPPASHLTYWGSRTDPSLQEPVYFFRLDVKNEGRSQARRCEALLEELWLFDAAGKPHRIPRFSPVKLRYDERGTMFVDINPDRSIFWNIGHISSLAQQSREEEAHFIDVPGQHADVSRFMMELIEYPYGQANCLVPGEYGLTIAVHSENSPPSKVYLKVNWSGKWQDTEESMFREIVISQVGRFDK